MKLILKGIRLKGGLTYMWVLDKSTNKMVKVDYTDLGLKFFSKDNANQENSMKPIVRPIPKKPKPKPKEKTLTELKRSSVLTPIWIR